MSQLVFDRCVPLIAALIDQGLSKFVLRSVAPVLWWPDELNWLADVVFDLQT